MDIVSDLPFSLKLIKRFPVLIIQDAKKFSKNEKEIWRDDFVTLSAEENDEIDIFFDSEDKEARLYLEALDIVPLEDINIQEDESGHIYRTISDSSFTLYKSNAGYDALRVDVFKISIFCFGEWYYGTFQILPKPINISEWKMMRDDLESEIRGLAQDIVRRNIGIGKSYNEKIPPKILYDFLVIKKYSPNVTMALMDIAENPRSTIITLYDKISANKSDKYRFDSETVKRYLIKSATEPTYKIPIKSVSYDIQDNRLLKMILTEYENKLNQFISLIEEIEKKSYSLYSGSSIQYKKAWDDCLVDFKTVALKLKKLTSIIKSQEWYNDIGLYKEPYVPHSFILDSRYSLLYQMYLDLKKEDITVELDPDFSYTWKRSSWMYEMWCYLKVCHIFMEEYDFLSSEWNEVFSDKVFFPFLESGTRLKFKKKNILIEIVYDECLPLNKKSTSYEKPLFMAKPRSDNKSHNRPDIVINVYETTRHWYLGSIILECKYRKLNSFWAEASTRSSREQLETYYNNARSTELLGGIGVDLNIRPVEKVIVFTPDDLGEGQEQQDFEILVKGFKAADNQIRVESVKKILFEEIDRIVSRYEKLQEICDLK